MPQPTNSFKTLAGGVPVYYDRLPSPHHYGSRGLEDRLALTFYMDDADDSGNQDDLLVNGAVEYYVAAQHWVAFIDETTFRHVSEERASS
jgi:hypothetical protein